MPMTAWFTGCSARHVTPARRHLAETPLDCPTATKPPETGCPGGTQFTHGNRTPRQSASTDQHA
jgi:hypothetical protein